MTSITRQAPAKVNLALDILGTRPDGYHDLRMIMQTVSLCDTVTLRETPEGFALRTDGGFLSPEKKSLEQQAAEAFFQTLGRPLPGLEVTLDKIIPAYAGLGGGSADVAALLRLLREAYAPELPVSALEEIGLRVGSDMPFCVRGGTCLAEGRGERLTDLPPLPHCWFVLCKPDFDLPTPALFARADRVALQRRPDVEGMANALESGDLSGVAERLCNVFEEILPKEVRQEVDEIRQVLLRCGALNAAMSGSGPTVFGMFRTQEETAWPMEILHRKYKAVFPAEPVGRL